MKRYAIVAVGLKGREVEIAQVDTHPGAIARAARRKYLNGGSQYVQIYIKDHAKKDTTV